jgi:hypothetical protein
MFMHIPLVFRDRVVGQTILSSAQTRRRRVSRLDETRLRPPDAEEFGCFHTDLEIPGDLRRSETDLLAKEEPAATRLWASK